MKRFGITAAVVLSLITAGLGTGYGQVTEQDLVRGIVVFRRDNVQSIDPRTLIPRFFVSERKAIVKKNVSCELAPEEGESVIVGINGLQKGTNGVGFTPDLP